MINIDVLLKAAEFIEHCENSLDSPSRVEDGSISSNDSIVESSSPSSTKNKFHVKSDKATHNTLEKNRRAHLKYCFENLQKELPQYKDKKKATNLSILNYTLKFVQQSQKRDKENEEEKANLIRRQYLLKQTLENIIRGLDRANIPSYESLNNREEELVEVEYSQESSRSSSICDERESIDEDDETFLKRKRVKLAENDNDDDDDDESKYKQMYRVNFGRREYENPNKQITSNNSDSRMNIANNIRCELLFQLNEFEHPCNRENTSDIQSQMVLLDKTKVIKDDYNILYKTSNHRHHHSVDLRVT